ncbi:MAG: hypothetical protein NXI24_19725 [bacterium]|nr:hypothetical protein [bacterium]
MDQAKLPDEGHWSRTFRNHVLGLEQFLAEHMQPRWRDRLPGEQTVYLAGMIARELDRGYRAQIQDYLVEDPEKIDRIVRRHAQCLGQNAPVVTLSRINAEHATLQIAIDASGDLPGASRLFLLTLPARYFGIASFYASQAGNQNLARIFDFFRNHLSVVVDILAGYLESLETLDAGDACASDACAEFIAGDVVSGDFRSRPGFVAPEIDPESLAASDAWRRFGDDTNERNRRKEFWEAAGLDPAKKNRMSGLEFRAMIDYTRPN